MVSQDREKAAQQFARALCYYAEKDESFYEDFWNRLCEEQDIFEEFCYYMEKQQFSCKTKISGYTVVDILVWQIDHFKAEMDRDNGRKENGNKMLLDAFDTFLKMKQNPEKYIHAMQEETGTDYPDKFR